MEDDWLLWQLADSAFPSGAFAHSGGLEAAWQHGEVRTSADLVSFLESSLTQAGHASLPFVTAAQGGLIDRIELDHLCECFLTNHVANRASRLQGRSFLASSSRIFPAVKVKNFPFHHFAPVFGVVTKALGLSCSEAARLFFFQHLRGLLAAAVRLGIVGPLEAQTLQCQLSPQAQAILAQCENLTVDDLAQSAPLLEIWQATQDRLYSRLFQS